MNPLEPMRSLILRASSAASMLWEASASTVSRPRSVSFASGTTTGAPASIAATTSWKGRLVANSEVKRSVSHLHTFSAVRHRAAPFTFGASRERRRRRPSLVRQLLAA
jgi:hypothetical protein